jgi:hypothetical protein
MDSGAIERACHSIYRQYPEFAGVRPSVRQSGAQTLLIFATKVKTADGKSLPRTLRVNVNEQGAIVKVTTSR